MRLNIQREPQARKTYEEILTTTLKEKDEIVKKENELSEKNQTAVRAHELVSYKLGLHKEGHIAPTESVKENLEEIGKKMINGKPMFSSRTDGYRKDFHCQIFCRTFYG